MPAFALVAHLSRGQEGDEIVLTNDLWASRINSSAQISCPGAQRMVPIPSDVCLLTENEGRLLLTMII